MLVFWLFSSGRYCLIQVSNEAMSTGCTSRPGRICTCSMVFDSSSRYSTGVLRPARATSSAP